ncbi:MAG: RNase adapter RapZ [Candidatus Limnocylindria bacterium]
MARTAASASAAAASVRPRAVAQGAPAPAGEHLVIISGLSGAGKSQASKLFEDIGYHCIDNLPPGLLDEFLTLRDGEPERYGRVALVLDIRAGDPAPAVERAAAALAARDQSLELIFLEADTANLVRRFSETRHRHPLEAEGAGIQAGIARERERLARTRRMADHVVDTSGMSIGELKERLVDVIPHARGAASLAIEIVTFGFKYGIPLEADLVFDVRFLTNPYWEPELKPLSGLDEPVRDFVLGQPAAGRFLDLVIELLELTLPAYRHEGKQRLRIALGCTGGYHRSIALAEELARRLAPMPDASVAVLHRELER